MKTTKNLFVSMYLDNCFIKQGLKSRQRRLDGRINEKAIKILMDYLPDEVIYNVTPNGYIKNDYLNLNVGSGNVHLFTNNTAAIVLYDDVPYYILTVIKAQTESYHVLETKKIVQKRLLLKDVERLASLKKILSLESLQACIDYVAEAEKSKSKKKKK